MTLMELLVTEKHTKWVSIHIGFVAVDVAIFEDNCLHDVILFRFQHDDFH